LSAVTADASSSRYPVENFFASVTDSTAHASVARKKLQILPFTIEELD